MVPDLEHWTQGGKHRNMGKLPFYSVSPLRFFKKLAHCFTYCMSFSLSVGVARSGSYERDVLITRANVLSGYRSVMRPHRIKLHSPAGSGSPDTFAEGEIGWHLRFWNEGWRRPHKIDQPWWFADRMRLPCEVRRDIGSLDVALCFFCGAVGGLAALFT